MARKTRKDESLVALSAAVLAKKAEVAYLKTQLHVREHKVGYKRGAIVAGVAAAIAALVEVA